MALSQAYSGSASISTTEFSLVNGSTSIATNQTVGVFQLWLDVANLAAGDAYEVYLRETVFSGGSQQVATIATIVGAQALPFVTGSFLLMNGWDFSIKQIAGSARTIGWSIRSAGGAVSMTEVAGNSSTVTGSEFSFLNGSTSIATSAVKGVYQLFLDTSSVLAGDQYEAFMREKITASGTQRVKSLGYLPNGQTLFCSGAYELINGWDFTAKKISGTNRAIGYSIRRAA